MSAQHGQAGHYFIIPFWREAGTKAHVVVTATTDEKAHVRCEVMRQNGQKATESEVTVRPGEHDQVPLDLFAFDSGAAHVTSEGGPVTVALRIGAREIPFGDVDALAGVDFLVERATAPGEHAVMANAGTAEIFVFVNDRQGPMIPPGGAAAIPMPEPTSDRPSLHLTVDGGDAVLSFEGAPVTRRN